MTNLDSHYSRGDLRSRIKQAMKEAGIDPEAPVSPEQIRSFDQLHTDHLFGTRALAELAEIHRTTRVLDVGSGLGGPARYLASTFGCTVTCLEPVLDFCDAAVMLNDMTGMAELVSVRNGSGTDIPLEDGSYDLVWTQNITMNVEDMTSLFSEIRRVLVPGGHYVFQEVIAGPNQPIHFPVPWASTSEMSFLSSAEETRLTAARAGFEIVVFDENPTSEPVPGSEASAPPVNDLNESIIMPGIVNGRATNQRNVAEDRVRRLRGLLRAV